MILLFNNLNGLYQYSKLEYLVSLLKNKNGNDS